MKYLSKLLFVAVAAIGFAACADDSDIVSPGGAQPGDMPVNITFSFADKAKATRSMVSGTETKVTTMQLVCFDANGLYLGIRNAEVTQDNPTATGFYDSGIIKGTVPQGTAHIHFIANRSLSIPLSHNVGTAEETVMQSEELSTAYDDTDHQSVSYWGYHKEASAEAMNTWLNPTSTPSVVYMIRDRAKVVLTYDPTGTPAGLTVEKIEWLIHNGRERGYLAPKVANWENYYANSTAEGQTSVLISTAGMNEYTSCNRYSLWTSESDNEDDHFDVAYQRTGTYTPQPQFLFDDNNTDLEPLKAILKVTYNDNGTTKKVYHVLLLNDNDKEKYDIVRNNTYYINCSLLSPAVAYYETLKDAIDGTEFMNADIEIDRSITDVNDDDYTLQILLPTETTSIVLNTVGPHQLDFAFRMVSDVSLPGSTNPDDFEVYWENEQDFCTDPVLTYVEGTKQFQITTNVIDGHLTQYLQDEWIVVKHKDSGLTRYIHVFVIDQFRYRISPKLTKVGDDYLLSFRIPPMVHSDPDNPDPNELVYPESLYPIDVKFTTSTLRAFGIEADQASYGSFGVSVESTSQLFDAANFEAGYNNPISSTANAARTHWYYQQADKNWDFWYTYSLKTYPENGDVNIYLEDVHTNIRYANVTDLGLFLYVEYFGKNYSVPVTN